MQASSRYALEERVRDLENKLWQTQKRFWEWFLGTILIMLLFLFLCYISWQGIYGWRARTYIDGLVATNCLVTGWNISFSTEDDGTYGFYYFSHFILELRMNVHHNRSWSYKLETDHVYDFNGYFYTDAKTYGRAIHAPVNGTELPCWYESETFVTLDGRTDPPPIYRVDRIWAIITVVIVGIVGVIVVWSMVGCKLQYRWYDMQDARVPLHFARIDLTQYTSAKESMHTFLMGTHARAGKGSSVQQFIHEPHFERNLIKAIYVHLGPRDMMPDETRHWKISQSEHLPDIKDEKWIKIGNHAVL